MGGMAATVFCVISFVVLGLGNGVLANDVNLSAAVGSVDADHPQATVLSGLPLNTLVDGTVQPQPATESKGATETKLPITDAASLDTTPQQSSSPEESPPTPFFLGKSEDTTAAVIEGTRQATENISFKNEHPVEAKQLDIPVSADLSRGGAELNTTSSIAVNTVNQEKSSAAPETPAVAPKTEASAAVTFVVPEVSGKDTLKEDPTPVHVEATLKGAKNSDTTDGEYMPNTVIVENEKTPFPTAASLVLDESALATTAKENSEKGVENVDAESQKDLGLAGATTKEVHNNVSSEGENTETNILTQNNEPLPTTATILGNETFPSVSSEAGKGLENAGRKLGLSEDSDQVPQNSSSAGNQSTATDLHVLEVENEKLSPPTVESLVGDGKAILPNNNETPGADPELLLNTQASQVQNISSDGMILPVAPNSTNTTEKSSTKLGVEKCPSNSVLPCVSKCCPFGQSLVNDKCRASLVRFIPQFTLLLNGFNDTKPENETEKMAKYNLIAQNICVKNRYRLEPANDSADDFHLLFNGSLWMPATRPHSMIPSDKYCMEVYKIDEEEVMMPLVCFEDPKIVESSFHFMVYPIGLLISVPFLLATFIVYNMIPELRNLHGKSLSCYVLCLMMAYIFLAVVQLGGQGFDNHVCVGVAFAIQFSFIACFFWLNVLCFDTWRNVFLHDDLGYTMEKSQERSFFIFYSIYAWSFTIVLIIVTMVMNFTPTIPSSYLKPGIGEKTCWFNTEREAFPYFYGPVGVLIIINVILFIMTAIKLILEHHKQAICVRTPTQTFQLCLTLFFIMGINWVMEIISWAAGGPPFIWYITDIFNTLQGIFIFVVFVMDERVRGLCKTELFPRLQEFFAACCPQQRTRRASTEPHYDSINGQEMVYMFKKEDIEQ